jgi:predicted HAD superfamily Cof-like phosphohydrolase
MRTMTNSDKVAEFMSSFGQEIKDNPEFPNEKIIHLRDKLIAEEFEEYREAINNRDMVAVADALTDLLYVIYGAGHAYGLNLDVAFNIVHASNMSKLGPDGKPIYREDGKIMKGPGFFEPDLSVIVK